MDHVVNRETAAMKGFSSQSCSIADEMEDVCSHLRQLLYAANDYMQDQSGQEALSIVAELVEETMAMADSMRCLAQRIKRSAELLEESDQLL